MTANPPVCIVAPGDPHDAPIVAASLDDLLGSEARIPSQLRTLCAIMRASQQPMFVAWGRRQQLLYNEAYGKILAERHPAAFGRPILHVWAEIAGALEALVARAYAGESIHMDDILLSIVRDGVDQEAHFSFSYTPIHGAEAGNVLGFFCACTETTDAMAQAKARAAEEARRLKLFENAPGFIAVLSGPEHRFEFANHAYVRTAGGRELIGRTVRQAFPEVELQGLIALLDDVYASGQRHLAHAMPVELRAQADQPATTRFLDFVYEPIANAHGKVTGIFVEGFDSTDTVVAQRLAREADSRRQEVLDSMAEGFIVLDHAYRVLEINAEGLRLDGRPQAQIIGRVHWDLWPASVGKPIESNYRHAMTQRIPVQFEHRYVGEGHDVCFDVHVYPVSGGIAAFYRDVTAQAAVATALQQSNERFGAAMQAIGVMWTNSADGRMNGAQPGWSGLTGQSEAEYRDFGWASAVHPHDAQPTLDGWHQAVAERCVFTFEHRVRRRDGAWRRFAIRAVPVIEPGGALREWVGVHIDITEATLAAEALRLADRRKDEFLATLAHELRNPLAPIRMASALLTRPDLPPERISWAAGVIARQSQTMNLLLDELLDLSRVKSGSIALKPEPVELAALIESAVETVAPLLDAKNHQLAVCLPAPPVLLQVDRLRTTQVFVNLLANAAKYTDVGGRLRIEATVLDGYACVHIIDNGIGLAPASLGEIFDVFMQVKVASHRSDAGLGIGLTLTKRLVELQGGRVEVSSDGLGQGSTFRVTLPLA